MKTTQQISAVEHLKKCFANDGDDFFFPDEREQHNLAIEEALNALDTHGELLNMLEVICKEEFPENSNMADLKREALKIIEIAKAKQDIDGNPIDELNALSPNC